MDEPDLIPRPELPLRARQLATWRRSLGVSAVAVAAALGFTRNYLSHVENGRKSVSEAQLDRILNAVEELAHD